MTIGTLVNRIVDAATDIAGLGLASLIFLLVWGRAINSPTAMKLDAFPLIRLFTKPLRSATNQGYDVRGED